MSLVRADPKQLANPGLTSLYGHRSGQWWILQWVSALREDHGIVLRTRDWHEYCRCVQHWIAIRSRAERKPVQKEMAGISKKRRLAS